MKNILRVALFQEYSESNVVVSETPDNKGIQESSTEKGLCKQRIKSTCKLCQSCVCTRLYRLKHTKKSSAGLIHWAENITIMKGSDSMTKHLHSKEMYKHVFTSLKHYT